MLGRLLLIGLLAVLLLVCLNMWASMGPRPSGARASGVPSVGVSSPSSDLSHVQGHNTLSAAFIDHVLSLAASPAVGLGADVAALSAQYGIDDAFTLAFFFHESSAGTRGVAALSHSWGNIICTPGFPSCLGRFRSYPTFRDGLLDFLRLLAREYFPRGLCTLEQIIPVYAPATENNVSGYIQALRSLVSQWRAGHAVI